MSPGTETILKQVLCKTDTFVLLYRGDVPYIVIQEFKSGFLGVGVRVNLYEVSPTVHIKKRRKTLEDRAKDGVVLSSLRDLIATEYQAWTATRGLKRGYACIALEPINGPPLFHEPEMPIHQDNLLRTLQTIKCDEIELIDIIAGRKRFYIGDDSGLRPGDPIMFMADKSHVSPRLMVTTVMGSTELRGVKPDSTIITFRHLV